MYIERCDDNDREFIENLDEEENNYLEEEYENHDKSVDECYHDEKTDNKKESICNCDGKPVTGMGNVFNAFTKTSPIDFYIYLNDVCINSLFGLEVEVYFTPDYCDAKENPGKYPSCSRYLAARVCKAVDIAKLCSEYKVKGCCDVKVPFKDIIVFVTCCYRGRFDFVVNGNYLRCPYRVKTCPHGDK